MSNSDFAHEWSEKFGLATAPWFEKDEAEGDHQVLLDGGPGTFALSCSGASVDPMMSASWIWSSDIPHHVDIRKNDVSVTRWDRPSDPSLYTLNSVRKDLDGFYQYLVNDRVASNRTVVEHLLDLFRRLRSLVHDAALPDIDTTEIFTAALERLIYKDTSARNFEVNEGKISKLNQTALEEALSNIETAPGSFASLRFNPTLAIRHASGQIFQEAHFELMRVGYQDLFGLVGAAEAKLNSRGGAHFTPPALARIIVEQAIERLGDLSVRKQLIIYDPACGSGAFLYEAMRSLRRLGFEGEIRFVGRDISIAAVSMAKFVLATAMRDWMPPGGCSVDIQTADSLADGMVASDLIVMNPPFISAINQSKSQRFQLGEIVGAGAASRGDFSMAFITMGLEALKNGGVLGALFPASLLSQDSAAPWREWLLENGTINFLGSIGDFGVFSQALVQVACTVLSKGGGNIGGRQVAMLTENDAVATGAAFRQLRKIRGSSLTSSIEENGWSIFPLSERMLTERQTWKLIAPADQRLLRKLEDANLAHIGDLFVVKQGVKTGQVDTFLLGEGAFLKLPKRERKFFRHAVMTNSIHHGKIVRPYYLFNPHGPDGTSIFSGVDELKLAVPTYFAEYLEPKKSELKDRADIRNSRREDWWGLSRSRDFTRKPTPKLVSKFFSGEGGFVSDVDGDLIPVTGHAWVPTAALTNIVEAGEPSMRLRTLLNAYNALFNTTAFIRLVSCFAPSVQGGQYDLSGRHMKRVPAPNFAILGLERGWVEIVEELAELGSSVELTNRAWRRRAEMAAAKIYGNESLDGFGAE